MLGWGISSFHCLTQSLQAGMERTIIYRTFTYKQEPWSLLYRLSIKTSSLFMALTGSNPAVGSLSQITIPVNRNILIICLSLI